MRDNAPATPAPAALPNTAVRVVKASKMLQGDDKLVYEAIQWFDGYSRAKGMPGAYISAPALGDRLGRSGDAIEHVRRKLVSLGLLGHNGRPGKARRYWPLLPAECVPSSSKPQPPEMGICRDRLDAIIVRRNGATTSAIPEPSTAQPSAPFSYRPEEYRPYETKTERNLRVIRETGEEMDREEVAERVANGAIDATFTEINGADCERNGADGAPTLIDRGSKEVGGREELVSAPTSSLERKLSITPTSTSTDGGAEQVIANAIQEEGARSQGATQEEARYVELSARLDRQRSEFESAPDSRKDVLAAQIRGTAKALAMFKQDPAA
jgi:hypothetical protein